MREQLARILSLDVDGTRFAACPISAQAAASQPGAASLQPQRSRIVQAARVKQRMAAELGHEVDIHGDRQFAFPDPARLQRLESLRGLTARKTGYLRALARAAQGGVLDASELRAPPADEALERLEGLPGIGPFSAQLNLVRGAGAPDVLPASEPRLGRAVALAYGLDAAPSGPELERLAANWRPYRSWVSFLLRVRLEEETHEIRG